MKKFTICMLSILMAIPFLAKTYSLQEALSNGSAEICNKIDGHINTVVIVDIQSDSESLSDYIYSELNYNFVNNLKKTSVAERNEFTLSLIKKEFEYQNSGEVSDATIQSVGNSLGADCVVLGKIEDSSSGWKFTLKAVQVETKKILCIWSGTISKNDKDVKYIVAKDNTADSQNNGVSYEDLANKATSVIESEKSIKDFILVEGGSFYMGSNRYRDNPLHEENVSSFYMCIHEVTQKEWLALMNTLPTKYTKHLGDDYPIDCISINKAIEYCNKRSLAENLQPCYIKEGNLYICDFKANGYRLPTESEWEYAAKGGKNKDSYVYSGSNSLESVAWTNGPHIVMTKNSNSIGLFDISGNVSELCWGKNQYYNTDNCNIRGGSIGPEHSFDVSFSNDWPGGDGDGFNTFTGFRVIRNAN